MRLPFLDRGKELSRLRRLLARTEPSFAVLYGRRRCGKSRLLQEVLPLDRAVYAVADDRDSALQRASLAKEISRMLPGFDRVSYPDWDTLFERWWTSAPAGSILAIDEFPALVGCAPDVPGLLQKQLDRYTTIGPHLVLAGSSQRMMQGLVLDASAPLFGRAHEILRVAPLPAGWIREGLDLHDDILAVEAFALWGGIPRYWELANEFPDLGQAMAQLVLDPLGVLHDEPRRLLLDDLRDTTHASSILNLVGQGCHRLSEIAARLGKPATSLSRPLQRLMELGLLRRDTPAAVSPRDQKRSLYRIDDPFLRFWFGYVEPNRSLLAVGRGQEVTAQVMGSFSMHVSGVWEDLVRASVPRADWAGHAWQAASLWWGPGLDRRPMEIDVVAFGTDQRHLLVGEAKWTSSVSADGLFEELRRKVANLPLAQGREVVMAIWTQQGVITRGRHHIFGPADVLNALR